MLVTNAYFSDVPGECVIFFCLHVAFLVQKKVGYVICQGSIHVIRDRLLILIDERNKCIDRAGRVKRSITKYFNKSDQSFLSVVDYPTLEEVFDFIDDGIGEHLWLAVSVVVT